MYRIIILIWASLALLGCASEATLLVEEETEALTQSLPSIKPNLAPEPITLEVWLDLDFTRDNSLYESLAEEFEAAYPQVEVEIFSFVRESIPQRVRSEVSSNIPPDVMQGHVHAMAAQGLAQPVDDLWAAWQDEDPETTSQFLPAALNEISWQDRHYGVPLDIYTVVLLYNREHFDQANLTYPEGDYDFFLLRQAAEILSDPESNRYGLGVTTDPWYAAAWITSAGGGLLSETSETDYSLTLDSAINTEALRFLTEMVENGYALRPTSRPRDYEDVRRQFLAGQISMYFGEAQDIHLIQSKNPDFPLGVAQLPQTPAREGAASVLGSSGLFIPKGAQHREIAFEFIKWMASDKYLISMATRQGRFPAKTWLFTAPEFSKNLSLIPFFNQLETARPYRLDLFPAAEEAFSDAVKASFYTLETPTEALQNAQLTGQASMVEPSP